MASSTEKMYEIYNYLLDARDPRMKEWSFSQPTHLLGILVFYLIFCLYVGPRYMKNRQPYKLQTTIRVYNVLQVILNAYILYLTASIIMNDFNWECQPVDTSTSERAMKLMVGTWWCWFSKVVDLCDTYFFILRKKMSQVTFLHVYHHTLMVFAIWIAVFYHPGGNPTVMAALNAFVHLFMYSYYFITSLGPQYQRYAWWKKHLTQMQIIQFVFVAGHTIPIMFRKCEYPRWLTGIVAMNALFFIYLFGKFYIRNYIRSSKSTKKN